MARVRHQLAHLPLTLLPRGESGCQVPERAVDEELPLSGLYAPAAASVIQP